MQSGKAAIPYYLSGKNPRLFISSGIHGDEQGVISSVQKAIRKNMNTLPAFFYVPVASPSAVKKGTRENASGQNVNRGFITDSPVDESVALMKGVSSYQFELSVSFHEDWELADFYMYDILGPHHNHPIHQHFQSLTNNLSTLNVGMLNGVDDTTDPNLGYSFTNGYRAFPYEGIQKHEDGSLDSWLVRNGVSRRAFNPEIPKKSPQEVKDAIVDAFFSHIILPFF